MISDGPPAIALGLDTARAGLMSEPPRAPDARILTWRAVARLLFVGVIMAAGTLGVLHWSTSTTTNGAPTMAFCTFVLFQLFNVFNVRTGTGTVFKLDTLTNVQLWLALGAVMALQVASVYWSPLQTLFDTVALVPSEWATCIAVASTVLFAEELRRLGARCLRPIGHAP